MAGPGGSEVGRLSIRVTANTTRMKQDIERAAKQAEKDHLKLRVGADTDPFIAEVIAAKAAVSENPVQLDVDAMINPTILKRRVKGAVEDAQEGNEVTLEARLSGESRAIRSVKELSKKLERAGKTTIPIDVKPSISWQDVVDKASLDYLQGRIDRRDYHLDVEPRFRPDAIERLQEKIAKIGDEITEPLELNFVQRLDMMPLERELAYNKAMQERFDKMEERMVRLTQELSRHKINLDIQFNQDRVEAEFEQALRGAKKSLDNMDMLEGVTRRLWIQEEERKQAHKKYLTDLENRTKRLGLWADVFREKMAIVAAGSIVSGITASVSLLGGYLAGAAGQAVALAGGLTQAAGVVAVLPGLLVGTAGAIGTLVVGMQGFGDAVSALMSDESSPEEIAEALEKLSPAAQLAAKSVAGLKPVFQEVKRGIQESLFTGLDGAIERIGDFATAMRPSLMSIASGWNSIFSQISGGLSSDISQTGFSTTFDNFGKMMAQFSVGIPAAIRGFAQLSAAGSQFFELFGQWGADKMQNFEGWVARITSDGSFERWVDTARFALGELGGTIRNVAGALGAVFNVSGGMQLLAQIRGITAEFEAWTKSAAGSQSIYDFFGDLRNMISSVHDVARTLAPVLGELFRGVSEFTVNFSSQFPNAMKGSKEAAEGFADAVAGLGGPMADILGSALVQIGQLGADLGPSLASLGESIAPFIEEVAEFASGAGAVFISSLTAILDIANKLMDIFPGLATALGAVFAFNKMRNLAQNFNASLLATIPAFDKVHGGAVVAAGGVQKYAWQVDDAAKKTSKLQKVATVAGRGLVNALPFAAMAVGVYALVDALHQRLNPALNDFFTATKQFDTNVANVFTQIENGSITAAEAVRQLGTAFDEVASAQKAAAEELANDSWIENFVEGFTSLGAVENIMQHNLENAGMFGKPLLDAAAKAAFEALPAVTQATANYTEAQLAATKAADEYGQGSAQHVAALAALDAATWALTTAKNAEAEATKTAGQRALDQLEAQLTLAAVQGDAAQAQLNVNSAVENYNKAMDEYGVGSLEAKAALGQLNQQMSIAVQTIGDAAYNQAVATGATDAGTQAFQAQIAYLDELIAAQGAHSEAAIVQKSLLMQTQASTMIASDAFAILKDSIIAVPDDKTIVVQDNSGVIRQKMLDLGYEVKTLPDGQIEITAVDKATSVAQAAVNAIGKMVGVITVTTNYVPGHPAKGNTGGGGGGGGWGWRDGGFIDKGSHPRIDDVPAMLAKGEYVLHAGAVKILGKEYLDELNSLGKASSSSKTAGDITGKFADGGSVDDWFDRAMARVASDGGSLDLGTVSLDRSPRGTAGGNTFILPKVDEVSLAREIDRINGFNPTIAEVL